MMRSAILPWSGSVNAQVTSDSTTNTIVNQSGNNFNILNGINKGNNLFHSFSNFSVPTDGSAIFDLTNTPNITTIFSRVTGGNVSNIDGLISTLNSSNPVSLFLMNPAGIVFGQNARLDIGGSFVGTTANSIKFADGVEFSAVNSTATALLTMSVPIGLQMGRNPGAIQVQGAGHTGQFSDLLQVSGLSRTTSLQVQPGNTLALVGGNIALDGGLLWAPGGRIELGSVTSGIVALNSHPQGFALSYGNASGFGNLQMTQGALASTQDLSNINGGSIQLQGKQVSLRDGSVVLIQNRSNQTTGDITVNATESLQIIGKSPNFTASSALVSETVAGGAAGNIVITTPQFLIDQGGFVLNRTYSSAPGGNIMVNAGQMVVNGFAAGDSNQFRSGSLLLAASNGSGKGGNIDITTQNLSIFSGSRVSASPTSSGVGGNVTVTADSIQIDGGTRSSTNTALSTTALGTANAGDLTLNTRTLSVQSGGIVSVSSVGSGNSGALTVNASESIEVNGTRRTLIGASVLALFDPNSPANAGKITLNTPVLNVRRAGMILIDNQRLGNAGSLTVNAERLQLETGGSIVASTRSGNGGNINLQLQEGLILSHGSNITATAGGNGNGGNILINSPIILGLENSDIIANAFEGKGGNIQISTQGIFGLKYRTQLTSENDITASSQFGVNGNVQITSPDIDPNSGLMQLPVNLFDASVQIATGCASNQGSSFVATGRGGIPQNPTQEVMSDVYDGLRLRTWSDIRDISAYRNTQTVQAQILKSPEVLVQATGWRRNADGKIEIFADESSAGVQPALTCAAVTKS